MGWQPRHLGSPAHGRGVSKAGHLAGGLAHILENGLEPLLELATVLGARHQRAHVEGDNAAAAHRLGHLAVSDALRQPLHHRRLAHTWLADEHWVVLAPPTEHLDQAVQKVQTVRRVRRVRR